MVTKYQKFADSCEAEAGELCGESNQTIASSPIWAEGIDPRSLGEEDKDHRSRGG